MFPRVLAVVASALLTLLLAGCTGDSATPSNERGVPAAPRPSGPAGHSVDTVTLQFCGHNLDPSCTPGSYVGPFVSLTPNGGHWDANGNPVNGGPVGADGSTGNNLTQEYCARNQDPACPIGTFVAPNAIKNPDGSHTYVVCEGTICTNPNHGGGDPPGYWDANGNPLNGGPAGADGSTGNNLTHDYCARNQDPACPTGTYVAPNAIKNPDGTNSYVVCDGTICTNPNHGGGDDCDGTICTNPNHGGGDTPDTDTTPGDDSIDTDEPSDAGTNDTGDTDPPPDSDDGPAFDDTPESSNDDGVIDDTPPDFDDSTDTGSFDDGN
ncbi:hypothetical protein PXJ67_00425 (plasmid) [Mycobacteroides chelonae]|jgi:hypothetical protein|uniref:Mesocentin n=2 Tax=Mycolicibacterium TaxID=1866885 RepID=A0A0M2K8H9_9MYCO|nr:MULTISPECIES: hypothetical protein [Mycobacteriaceae]KKF03284.1 hypothetical protein WN67_04140 [Mycolicibacterium obuense]OAN37215.1 hypothetical protein A4X20_23745 [Mycolicibacterium iranicum]WED89762.1 hypothetical protein PXJ67_00425 [Mycobacteroides chelonae]